MNTENENKHKPKFYIRWLKYIWGFIPIFIVILIIATLFEHIQSKGETIKETKAAMIKKETPAINVVTLTLAPSLIRDRINLPGVVEPWVKLEVLTEVSGKVMKKHLEEGSSVRKGDVICQLDVRDYQNSYNSIEASYDAAEASLKRLKELHKGQLTTRSQLDEANAQVGQLKAALDTAKLNIERCTIRAPISGVINRLRIEEGQYLNSADPVAEILQIDRVKVRVGIPESDIDAVRKLKNFDVKIAALNHRVFSGKLFFLSKTADPLARLYDLVLELQNTENEILPDMFVRVEIVKKEVQESLSIPLYAVINQNNNNVVYVAEEGVAKPRDVEIGIQEGWRAEIIEGLASGDDVIVVGHRGVNDGDKVNVVRNVTDIQDIMK